VTRVLALIMRAALIYGRQADWLYTHRRANPQMNTTRALDSVVEDRENSFGRCSVRAGYLPARVTFGG
jgi:hypothetical protein